MRAPRFLERSGSRSINQALIDFSIGVHAPVAQKWPVRAMPIHSAPIDVSHHDFFAIHR